MLDVDLSSVRLGGSWPGLKAHILKKIESLRDDLETQNTPEVITAQLRGEIGSLRDLIRAVEPELPEREGQPLDYNTVRAPQHQS